MSKSHRSLCVSFSSTDVLNCVIFLQIYIFFCMVKFKFLVHLLVDHLAHPAVSSLILFLILHITHICYFVASYLSRLFSALCHILFQNFYYVWYIVAIPKPGIVYYQRACHRCVREKSRWMFMISGSFNKILRFNSVKSVILLFYTFFLDWVTELASGFSRITFTVYIYCPI